VELKFKVLNERPGDEFDPRRIIQSFHYSACEMILIYIYIYTLPYLLE
jgi:hypothetical protein